MEQIVAYQYKKATDDYLIVASSQPHDETPLFAKSIPADMPMGLPMMQNPYLPWGWLQSILAFRRKDQPRCDDLRIKPIGLLRAKADLLALTLLRSAAMIEREGEIASKIMLSAQAPPNELKTLMESATQLALDTFESLPPHFATLREKDIEALSKASAVPSASSTTADDPGPASDSFGSQRMSSEGPPNPPPGAPVLPTNDFLMVVEDYSSLPSSVLPLPYPPQQGLCDPSMPSSNPDLIDHMSAFSSSALNSFNSFSAPPFPLRPGFFGFPPWPPHLFSPPGPYAPLGTTSAFARPPPDVAAVFQRSVGGKKGPAVGDRPLTPPAQGWHAKYSSGVTGVVWDRVHQAWVVSWTLAGKRTFRHFTCKSYGGFDKAREAAIEFRLARNKDIAAYNKRGRDRR